MPAGNRLAIALDGITDLPPGKLASIVTYLERPLDTADAARAEPAGFALAPLRAAGIGRYLALHRILGERWMWFSRLVRPAGEVAAIIDDPRVSAFAVAAEGRDVGLLELDRRHEGGCEIVFIGLVEGETGRGLGRALVAEAARLAALAGERRLWLHTCTLDDPRAVGFYRAMGFAPYKQAVEVVDDPRLTGAMRADAAPQVPIYAAPVSCG